MLKYIEPQTRFQAYVVPQLEFIADGASSEIFAKLAGYEGEPGSLRLLALKP